MLFNFLRRAPQEPKVILPQTDAPAFTPDLWRLEQFDRTLLFEVGDPDNSRGFPLHIGFTIEKLSLWKKAHEGIAFRMTQLQVPRARVKGFLYSVPAGFCMELDRERQNKVLYERKRVPLIIPELDASGNPLQILAWMYVGKKNYWEPRVTWDQQFHRNNPEFTLATTRKDNRPWLNEYYDFQLHNQAA